MSEKAKEDEILKLAQLVDRSYRFTLFDFFFRGSNAFAFIGFIGLFVLVGFFLVIAPSVYDQIVVATSFSAFSIAFFSLLARFGEEHIVEVNFKRFGKCVDKNKQPLLKALIKMKVKNQEFKLEQIYNMNESMFHKEKLLERLYEWRANFYVEFEVIAQLSRLKSDVK